MTDKRKRLFIVSIFLLILYFIFMWSGKSFNFYSLMGIPAYMDVPVISKGELAEKISGKDRINMEDGIYFYYAKAPLDVEDQTLYISQSTEKTEWEGFFDLDQSYEKAGYDLYLLEDEFWDNKKEAMRQGHKFSLYAIGEDYYQLNVIFSGLGVMSISEVYEFPKEEIDYMEDPDTFVFENQIRYLGDATLLAADVNDSYQVVQSSVVYHFKGAASMAFPKKSYSFTFVDTGGKDVGVSVLGMESSAKWKLNSLYTDDTLLREKSAIDIWQAIDEYNPERNNGSFDGEYIELIVDNNYVGVYLVIEGVDEHSLEMDNNDVLYKCVDWNYIRQDKFEESIANGWKVQLPFRIRYPKEIIDYRTTWNPIKEFSYIFWDEGTAGDITLEQRVNVPNIIDVDIFLEVCAMDDNNYKNMYYAAHVREDGTYTMTLHPWDFDLSFGHRYMGGHTFYESGGFPCDLRILDDVIGENPEIATQLYNTYMEYRETILSDERIEGVIKANWDKLQSSGAHSRNLQLWDVPHSETDIDSVLGFVEKRLKYTDAVYQSQYGNKQ